MGIHYAIIRRNVLNAVDKALLNNRKLYLRRRPRCFIRDSPFELLWVLATDVTQGKDKALSLQAWRVAQSV